MKGRSPQNLEALIEVPNVLYVKVPLLSVIMTLTSPEALVLRPSYPFRRNFGRSGKGSFTERAKIDN